MYGTSIALLFTLSFDWNTSSWKMFTPQASFANDKYYRSESSAYDTGSKTSVMNK